MSYRPLDVTPEQRENLTKLAVYLLTEDIRDFEMCVFRAMPLGDGGSEFSSITIHRHIASSCGTVGCAIGHGPEAGIAPHEDDENWLYYACNQFGASPAGILDGSTPLWLWAFDDSWSRIDNTATGAGYRIQIALEKGIPNNAERQRLGIIPLEYAR